MFTYRCVDYIIAWVDGVAHFTIFFPQRSIVRGVGNHGAAKTRIDTYLTQFGYVNQ